jgi:hypothetical protein
MQTYLSDKMGLRKVAIGKLIFWGPPQFFHAENVFTANNFSWVHFATKVSVYFWKCCENMNLLKAILAYFWEKSYDPVLELKKQFLQ